MLRKKFFLCVVLLILPSCIGFHRYPDEWSPPSAAKATCPDIAGLYDNHGENAGGDKRRLSLILIPTWEMVYQTSITHTEITQTNDLVKLTFLSNNIVAYEKNYSKAEGEFYCDSGWMIIDQPAHPTLSKFILGVDWGWDRLSINTLGDLVIRKKSSCIGLFGVIPVAEIDWLWFRFKKYNREASTNKEDAPDPKAVR